VKSKQLQEHWGSYVPTHLHQSSDREFSRYALVRPSRHPWRLSKTASISATLLTAAMIMGSCSSNSDPEPAATKAVGDGGPNELFAETASFETVQGKPQRVTFGLSTVNGRILHGGSVFVSFRPVNDKAATPSAPGVPAKYLAVAGPATSSDPTASIGALSDGVGVYAATYTFPAAGFWTAEIRQSKDGKRLAETAVDVKANNAIPDVGDPAPITQNPVLPAAPGSQPSVPINRIDSRSGPDALTELADPALHTEVIADLLKAHRPFVVVVSTPAYCQSKFCGPITDLVDERAKTRIISNSDFGFVHLEVFADATVGTVNKWAAEWLVRDGDGREPWVFLVDRNGKIAARFDNVMTPEEFDTAIAKIE
jgi:hypothetical protein